MHQIATNNTRRNTFPGPDKRRTLATLREPTRRTIRRLAAYPRRWILLWMRRAEGRGRTSRDCRLPPRPCTALEATGLWWWRMARRLCWGESPHGAAQYRAVLSCAERSEVTEAHSGLDGSSLAACGVVQKDRGAKGGWTVEYIEGRVL